MIGANIFRRILLAVSLMGLAMQLWAVPMWSRRYSVPCSTCHSYPSLQLTSVGVDFFRKGHRFDKDTFDKDITHLISAHGEWDYDVQKGEPSQFTQPELHVHAGGAFSEYFSTYVDANVNSDFESLYLQATKALKGDSFVTARAGKISPTIVRNYANGLMASASTPLIITDATLGENPFTPARDDFGANLAMGWKSFFIEAGVVNGPEVPGQAAVHRHKDLYASGEFALPDGLSGLGAYYHRGGYDIGDPAAATFDRYDRAAVFANFTRDEFRLAGAYLTGKDKLQSEANRKINGYYVQADLTRRGFIVPFVRYDIVKTDVESSVDRVRKATIGFSLKIFENDVSGGRLVLEGARNKAGGENSNSALLNLLWAF